MAERDSELACALLARGPVERFWILHVRVRGREKGTWDCGDG
jgi:hypothetical protein